MQKIPVPTVPNDVPDDVFQQWIEEILRSDQIVSLLKKRETYVKRMYVFGVVTINNEIEKLVTYMVNSYYLPRYNGESKKIKELYGRMPPSDSSELIMLTHSIYFMCDMIETFVSDYDQIISRYSPGFRLSNFDDLISVGRKAKESLRRLDGHTDHHYQVQFACVADDLTELIRNKVKSLIRKTDKKSQHHDSQS